MTEKCVEGGWLLKVKDLVEQEATPFLCVYLDQKTQQVNLVADSESQKNFRESNAFSELKEILTKTNEKKANLQFYNHLHDTPSCHQSMPVKHHQLLGGRDSQTFLKDQTLSHDGYNKLPVEILRIIFGFLKPSDLRNILLVSQTWKSVAEEPILWTGFDLPDVCRSNGQALEIFSKTSLFSKLQHFALSEFKFKLNDEDIKLFLDLDLSSIEISKVDLSEVSDELLEKLVISCRKCDIKHLPDSGVPYYGKPGVDKIISILCGLQDNPKLKTLKLYHYSDIYIIPNGGKMKMDLSSLASGFLAKVFSKLDSLALENLLLNSDQVVSIFDHIVNLHSLSLRGIHLDANQTKQLIDIVGKTSQLKSLSLSEVELDEIPAVTLAEAINKIETVDFEDISIYTDQIEEILLKIISGDSEMKNLSLIEIHNGFIQVGLYGIDAAVFAKAVNKLESVNFDGDLSKTMTKELFKVMSFGTNLKTLGTPRNQIAIDTFSHIAEVDPEVLAMALNNLHSVRFDFGGDQEEDECFLTVPQMHAFFKQLSLKTELKTISRKDHADFSVQSNK